MQPSFNIRTETNPASSMQLLAELGPHWLSLVCAEIDSNTITNCVVYHFAAGLDANGIKTALANIFAAEPLLAQVYKRVDIVYAFEEAILTPHEVYNVVTNTTMLDGVFGDVAEAIVKTDFIYKHNLHNVYRVPATVTAAVQAGLPLAGSTHQYSLLVDAFSTASNRLDVIFYPYSLVVVLHKEGKLQVVRQFNYDAPETAAWYLLNTCTCFGLTASNVQLVLHGMIDGKSVLYAELYKYFLQIDFAILPSGYKYSIAMAAVPHHFFSHLFAMMLCV